MTNSMMVPADIKTFSDSHLQLSLNYINPKYYPELYKDLYGHLKFIDRRLVDINSFEANVPADEDAKDPNSSGGSTQTARLYGEGINKDEVWASIDRGYLLSKVPPSIVRVNGKDQLCNGRTRHGKLLDLDKTNMIVDYY